MQLPPSTPSSDPNLAALLLAGRAPVAPAGANAAPPPADKSEARTLRVPFAALFAELAGPGTATGSCDGAAGSTGTAAQISGANAPETPIGTGAESVVFITARALGIPPEGAAQTPGVVVGEDGDVPMPNPAEKLPAADGKTAPTSSARGGIESVFANDAEKKSSARASEPSLDAMQAALANGFCPAIPTAPPEDENAADDVPGEVGADAAAGVNTAPGIGLERTLASAASPVGLGRARQRSAQDALLTSGAAQGRAGEDACASATEGGPEASADTWHDANESRASSLAGSSAALQSAGAAATDPSARLPLPSPVAGQLAPDAPANAGSLPAGALQVSPAHARGLANPEIAASVSPAGRYAAKISPADETLPAARTFGKKWAEKSFLARTEKVLTTASTELGIDVAKSSPAMPAPSHSASAPAKTGHDAAMQAGVGGISASITNPAAVLPPPEAMHTAHQAVAVVLDLADRFSAHERRAVNLQFSVAGENLNVRVELRADEVRTTFRTDSPELRSALAHEWQSVTEHAAGERTVRLAAPVFAAHDGGAPGFGAQTSSQQRDARTPRQEFPTGLNFGRARPAPPAAAAPRAAATGIRIADTARHLYTLV